MPDADDSQPDNKPLNERIVDLMIYVPAGIAVSLVDEFPKLATRGREQLGVQVNSARAIGEFVVKAGGDELKRRSVSLLGRKSANRSTVQHQPADVAAPWHSDDHTHGVSTGDGGAPSAPVRSVPSNGHIPEVSTLSIPGFDSLSASQVVQRLDGLNRTELVSVRAYEASTRGRRTILNRVDQLLDERS
jgi:hypothetical protein